MKKSFYTYFIPSKQGYIGLNTVSNMYVYIHPAIYSLYEECRWQEMEEKYPKQYEQLVLNGFLVEDSKDELAELEESHDWQNNASINYDLTLLPSLDCNLRCWYCYEKHIGGSRLSQEVSQSILKHVEHVLSSEKIQSINVTMFGGEPLLYFKEELYPLLKGIQKIATKREKYSSFFFVTNAVCIDETFIPLFNELNAQFQISIDGYREKHDKIKYIPATKEGTYDRVIQTIRQLADQIENTYINIRLNYDDKTLQQIDRLIADLEGVDRRKINVHLERVWQTSDRRDPDNELLKSAIHKLLVNKICFSYMNLFRKAISCKSSMKNQSIISYDGRVYKCTGRDFTEEFMDGQLQTDGTIIWNEEQLTQRMQIRTYDNEACRTCRILPFCWGPCNQKLLESGISKESIARYCQLNLMEMPMEEYILYRFNNELLKRQNHENT